LTRFVSIVTLGFVTVACQARNERAPLLVAPGMTATAAPPVASPTGSAPVPARGENANEPFVGTAGIVDVVRHGSPSVLAAVRAARHEGYDRVVFEFTGGVPGYHVEYVDRPVRDCGAGDPKPIAGDAWLEVRFFPAFAHTEQGQPTVPFNEFQSNLPNVLEVERTCDFEAVVTWVLGTRSPKRYRVLELSDPSRVVIDVRH
jgi:hypothetical protein